MGKALVRMDLRNMDRRVDPESLEEPTRRYSAGRRGFGARCAFFGTFFVCPTKKVRTVREIYRCLFALRIVKTHNPPVRKHWISAVIVSLAVIATVVALVVVQKKHSTPWELVKANIMPEFMPAENKTKIPLVARPFSKDIDVGFVIDKDLGYTFVDKGRLKEWNIDEETLARTAMENLETRSQNVNLEVDHVGDKASPENTYVMLELKDGYSAVRLLSTAVRRAVIRELGEEYVAAVPTRDFLIFWSAKFPLSEQFIAQIQKEYDEEKTYKLSPELFLVNQQGIQMVKMVKK